MRTISVCMPAAGAVAANDSVVAEQRRPASPVARPGAHRQLWAVGRTSNLASCAVEGTYPLDWDGADGVHMVRGTGLNLGLEELERETD